MKKIVFGLIATVVFGHIGNAQKKVTIVDIKGIEVGIFVDVDEKDSFKEFYLFQYNEQNLQQILEKKLALSEIGKDFIRLKSDRGENILFTLNPELKREEDISIDGYGLSFRKGNYTLISVENPTLISDLLLLNGERIAPATKCDSGGAGSSECSTDGGAAGFGASCSVKCNKGYYSCCNDNLNECRCRPEKKSLSIAPN
jgi:hypothetical protein